MIKSKILAFILIGFFFAGCTQSFDSKDEMLEYISDESNGYRFSKRVNDVNFILQYKPTDIMALQESEGNALSDAELLKNKYGKSIFFTLSMDKEDTELLNNIKDRQKYLEVVNDLTFKMDDKITFLSGTDTIPMLDYSYPRFYGMSKSTTILLVFPRNLDALKSGNLQLIIQDIGFYTGEVKFKIDNSKIINEPQLNFNKLNSNEKTK